MSNLINLTIGPGYREIMLPEGEGQSNEIPNSLTLQVITPLPEMSKSDVLHDLHVIISRGSKSVDKGGLDGKDVVQYKETPPPPHIQPAAFILQLNITVIKYIH
jgi:hypothetical protein